MLDTQGRQKLDKKYSGKSRKGWICPVCGRGVAPWKGQCDCQGHRPGFVVPKRFKPYFIEPTITALYQVSVEPSTTKYQEWTVTTATQPLEITKESVKDEGYTGEGLEHLKRLYPYNYF